MKRFFFIVIIFLFILTTHLSLGVLTSPQTISLLSVSELDNGSFEGNVASLTLTIKPGKGAIFIESYPVSKVDTQVATRLANEVACEFSDIDCSKYDFFYTIRANSPLIGGPSGGGATAVLTLASLEDVHLKENFAMTGSILSGGIIGPVGGVREKISAANKYGKEFVLVPYLSINNKSLSTEENKSIIFKESKDNQKNRSTINITNNSSIKNVFEKPITFDELNSFDIKVYPVLSLNDAFELATGQKLKTNFNKQLVIDKNYLDIMKTISSELCSRSETLISKVKNISDEYNQTEFNKSFSLYNKSFSVNDSFYSKASLCFSANNGFQKLILDSLTNKVLLINKNNLLKSIDSLSQSVNKIPLDTMADLESFVIVNERLLESKNFLNEINDNNISTTLLASAIERYKSAVAWSAFFNMESSEVIIDNTYLSSACDSAINNAENRLTYLRLIVPKNFLFDIEEGLSKSYVYRQDGLFAQCLFKATKTKAYENLILSSLMVSENKLPLLIKAKLSRSKNIISFQEVGFPILGFSYYEYSNYFLQNNETFSSLLFSEYSLAFSDISKYFPPKTTESFSTFSSLREVIIFIVGFLLGIVFFMVTFPPKPIPTNKTTKKKPTRSNKNKK